MRLMEDSGLGLKPWVPVSVLPVICCVMSGKAPDLDGDQQRPCT